MGKSFKELIKQNSEELKKNLKQRKLFADLNKFCRDSRKIELEFEK